MNTRTLIALVALLAAAPVAVRAQASTTAPTTTQRELAAERREAARARREARRAMVAEQRATRRAARLAAMPADQQQYLRDLRTYRGGLRDTAHELTAQVTAGTLTRDEMARQLKAYRDANRPMRPASMPDRTRTP
jgi:hypothetical protein